MPTVFIPRPRQWRIFIRGGIVAFLACWGLAVLSAFAAEPLTLDEYFTAALARSEVIATQGELIRQAEERYRQANAALYPTLSGIGTYIWQDRGALNTSLSPTRQPNARLALTQPVFRGLREFAALRQTQALIDAQGADYQSARIQLFKDVAQNYYDVLAIEQDLVNLEEQIEQNRQREDELQDRIRIGRSRVGEVLTVQTTISTLRAQVESRKAELAAAREAFAFLSGLPATTPLRDGETLPDAPESLDVYLERLPARPDVKAARQRLGAADENIAVVRGEHWPTLDLSANRYLERSGNLENVDWDVQLALTVPLYAGGAVQSRVREAQSQREQAVLAVSQVERRAQQEIHALHQTVVLDRNQLAALEKATKAALKNYEAQRRDYRLGLVTNLDVLQALTAFQENERALDRARYVAKLNFLKLEAAAVRRPAVTEPTRP